MIETANLRQKVLKDVIQKLLGVVGLGHSGSKAWFSTAQKN